MSAEEKPVIEFTDVTFAYGSQTILEDVSFRVQPRETLSIVGPNGGGKSTILKLAMGLLQPNSGEIRILGHSPVEARRSIGYMPQYLHFDPRFPVTVKEILHMGILQRGGFYSRQDRAAVRDIIDELNLEEIADSLFTELSGGQQQRVIMGRAIVCAPQALLLDEPTASVDAVVESRFYDLVKELSSRMAIMIVSHDLGFVSSLVERVLCVNRRARIHPTRDITGQVIHDLYAEHHRLVDHDTLYPDHGEST